MIAMQAAPAPKEVDVGMTFGDWVRSKREQAGMSLRGLAEKSGVSHPHIRNLESGEVGPSRPLVARIAEALEADVDEAMLAAGFAVEGAITYIKDPAEHRIIESYRGASTRDRHLLERMSEEIDRLERDHTIGGNRAE